MAAATSVVSMAMPFTHAIQKKFSGFKSLPVVKPSKFLTAGASKPNCRFEVKASSIKEKAVTELTAAALAASMVIPQVAEAAGPGLSPSLNNFLLSIAAGGVVLAAIFGAVIGVSNFDPVKRT